MTTFLSIIGTRPQYIKLAPLYHLIKKHSEDQIIIIDTGQHYDDDMSKFILENLKIQYIDYNLHIKENTHGIQTGKMMIALEPLIESLKIDHCFVFGDTNSTLAGVLVARKLKIPTSHIEAGIRMHDIDMAEEINRRATDSICNYLFAPSLEAVNNLIKEHSPGKIIFSGDIMFDAIKLFEDQMLPSPEIKDKLDTSQEYILLTLHRAENVDNKHILSEFISVLGELKYPVLFPCHPRTKKQLQEFKINIPENLKIIHPLPYLELLYYMKYAQLVITDSGGLQKEAYYLGKRCVVLFPETPWKELEKAQIITTATIDTIKSKIKQWINTSIPMNVEMPYGNGNTANIIYDTIKKDISKK